MSKWNFHAHLGYFTFIFPAKRKGRSTSIHVQTTFNYLHCSYRLLMDMLDSGRYQQKYSMRINWQYEVCNRVFCNRAESHGVAKSQTQLSELNNNNFVCYILYICCYISFIQVKFIINLGDTYMSIFFKRTGY